MGQRPRCLRAWGVARSTHPCLRCRTWQLRDEATVVPRCPGVGGRRLSWGLNDEASWPNRPLATNHNITRAPWPNNTHAAVVLSRSLSSGSRTGCPRTRWASRGSPRSTGPPDTGHDCSRSPSSASLRRIVAHTPAATCTHIASCLRQFDGLSYPCCQSSAFDGLSNIVTSAAAPTAHSSMALSVRSLALPPASALHRRSVHAPAAPRSGCPQRRALAVSAVPAAALPASAATAHACMRASIACSRLRRAAGQPVPPGPQLCLRLLARLVRRRADPSGQACKRSR
jgi:hypothetical protein